jgi:GNAT superfamily N-acetyltransferase
MTAPARPTMRHAAPHERAAVTELLLAAYCGYERNMSPELFARYMADLPPAEDDIPRTIVAAVDDDLVGTARLYAPGTAAVDLPDGVAWVRAVAVRADAQGSGIARQLMAECHRRAETFGAHAVMLHTTSFMARAVELYEALGYARTPEWDIDADRHYPVREPSGMTAIAYRLELSAA